MRSGRGAMLALALLVATTCFGPSWAIYPADHWTYSTEITSSEQFTNLIQEAVASPDTTLMGNTKVRFADINLAKASIRGPPHNPGEGGWPTIRHYSARTGVDGAKYVQKTTKSMCDELGDEEYMVRYVEEAAQTSLCDVVDGTGCDEQSLAYLMKQKALGLDENKKQLARLDGMVGKEMKDDLKVWLKKRQRILRNLIAHAQKGDATTAASEL